MTAKGPEKKLYSWETDFYTPPVLGGAALFAVPRRRCIKLRALVAQYFYTPLALKGRAAALEVYKKQSPDLCNQFP